MIRYEVLLFDADATLFDFQKSSREAFRDTMKHLEIAYSEELYSHYNEINQGLWEAFEQQKITTEELRTKRYEILFQENKVNRDATEANGYYLEQLSAKPYLIPGAQTLIETVTKQYRIAIITNGLAATQYRRIERSPLHPYIESVFVSEDIGYTKPDSRYFDYVLAELAPINRQQSLVIGDSLTADIQGGLGSGMDTCWYNPRGVANHTTMKPTYEISSLEEVMDII